MPRVLFSDPVHVAMQLSRNARHRATLTEDPEVRMGEATDVRKNGRQIGGGDAEPRRKRGGKFVDGRRGNPATLSGIVGAVDRKGWEGSEQAPALHGAAENELMAPPSVIGPGSVCWISSAEIGRGERRHLRCDAQLDRRIVKCIHSLAQLREQIRLTGQLVAVGIVTANGAEENLALH